MEICSERVETCYFVLDLAAVHWQGLGAKPGDKLEIHQMECYLSRPCTLHFGLK